MNNPFNWAFISTGTLDVMKRVSLMDECRRQMGLAYPFEKEDQHV